MCEELSGCIDEGGIFVDIGPPDTAESTEIPTPTNTQVTKYTQPAWTQPKRGKGGAAKNVPSDSQVTGNDAEPSGNKPKSRVQPPRQKKKPHQYGSQK
jgi:hypothetical protein